MVRLVSLVLSNHMINEGGVVAPLETFIPYRSVLGLGDTGSSSMADKERRKATVL